MTLYNSQGQVVRILNLGYRPAAGIYDNKQFAVHWDGRDAGGQTVASGLYFYTLKAEDFTATRKLSIWRESSLKVAPMLHKGPDCLSWLRGRERFPCGRMPRRRWPLQTLFVIWLVPLVLAGFGCSLEDEEDVENRLQDRTIYNVGLKIVDFAY